MINWRCFLLGHKWGKWSGLISTYNGVRQFRQCERCNRGSWRRVCSNNDANPSQWDGKALEGGDGTL